MKHTRARVGLITSAGIAGALVANADAATNPARPHGQAQIESAFGAACNSQYDDTGVSWPWGNDQQPNGTVLSHALLYDEHWEARFMVHDLQHNSNEVNRAVWGRACRKISGTNKWSTHAWGIAYDTNSVTNPQGQSSWNGIGDDSIDYKNALPDVWQNSVWVNHYWGLNFSGSAVDPMHFQYATGY